ncbi:MAG: ZIP family metal transporter [Nitrososphaeraceae archaeon]
MEEYENINQEKKKGKSFSIEKKIIFGIIPFLALAGMISFLLSPAGQNLISSGIPLPEITFEKIEFQDDIIVAYIRNTGPLEVTISQADVNDRIHSAAIEPSNVLSRLSTAKVIIPFSWNPAEPYEIGITVDDGTRFSKLAEAAAPAPTPNFEKVSLFAIIGTYVGIIPVMIGMLWFPFIRRLKVGTYKFFLSITVGLLVFLGIEALLEANDISTENLAEILSGQMLIILVTIISFIFLLFIANKLVNRSEKKLGHIDNKKNNDFDPIEGNNNEEMSLQKPNNDLDPNPTTYLSTSENTVSSVIRRNDMLLKPLALSLMISIGIGLHNFGEGLAIGSAVLLGEVALSTFLIVGFTIHNTTEGLAIVAPFSKGGKLKIRKLIIFGLIAGGPTIIGAWIGGFIYSPISTVIFLSIGAGAIFQVAYSIFGWLKEYSSSKNILTDKSIAIGFIIGMSIMYITGLLI